MMEIKFRAWDTEAKCYIKDPILVDNFGNAYVVCEEASNKQGTCLITGKPNVIIEQDTGLKDRNGKEIYEGDIIQEKGLLSLTCVEWDKNRGQYITKVLDTSKCVATVFHFDIIDALECEVVGNIYENPELIGEEK